MYKILLIDDEEWEQRLITDYCKQAFGNHYRLDHTRSVDQAVHLIKQKNFDFILLDNVLSGDVTARVSVPFLKGITGDTPIIIISNIIEKDYLKSPDILGVDHVVAKDKLESFLKIYKSTVVKIADDN